MKKKTYLAQAAIQLCQTSVFNQTASILAGSTGSAGSTSTLLSSPYDLDVDNYNNMYVVDRNNHRIQRFFQGKIFLFKKNKKYKFF